MNVFETLSFTSLNRLRKFVRREHLRTFGVELPLDQVDQFIECYWGEYMEEQLAKAVDSDEDETLH
jgi:hypothetical protein